MDSDRFDRLSRSLAATLTRRTSLGAVTLLGLAPVVGTEAKKRKKHRKKKKKVTCPSGYTACGKQCFDLSDNVQHCGTCATVCSPGKTCCQGVCVNLQDNDSHCAACGKRCQTLDNDTPRIDAAEICQAGVCVECSIAGNIRDTNQNLPCCRGLKFCPGNAQGSTASRCIPENQAC
jgi:hypothetical protein